jgi:hypothetical protein
VRHDSSHVCAAAKVIAAVITSRIGSVWTPEAAAASASRIANARAV